MQTKTTMKIILDEDAIMPTRAHPTDAGLDLYTPYAFRLRERSSIAIDTGVHIQLPHETYGDLKSKSGLNVKHDIRSEGVIDENYTGSIVVKLYNDGDHAYDFHAGDKITQLIVTPYLAPDLEVVDKLDETDRGDAGFGSTGR